MRTAYTALAVLPLLLSSACGGGADKAADADAPPALTLDQAKTVLTEFQTTTAKAAGALNAALLTPVETGPQLEMDTAAYKLLKATDKKAQAVSYADPIYYIPRIADGQPRWFAVDAQSGTDTRHALLFVEEGDGSWKLAADPQRKEATPLKGVTVDGSGFAEVASDGLALQPAQLADAHATLLTDGPQAAGAAGLASGPQTTDTHAMIQKIDTGLNQAGVAFSTTFTPAGTSTYALRTDDGGAFVWYVLRQKENYKGDKVPVAGDLVGLAPKGKVKNLTATTLIQYLASVPTTGDAQVTAVSRKAVEATSS
ncbi:hypothetical protein EDD29_7658 [Actinocorallia herbida]|uniref:DUF8094 domain-containing protein n=1 Tax=Actinocorallia herbida TaxID=58109 RepID=A0A3N1D8X7_9ACTN|nr:hypothetical protein [Actinocorallia herbida]ROO89946.1 hypothetical protein EDD29_7658 [Actinocorallia herbida]